MARRGWRLRPSIHDGEPYFGWFREVPIMPWRRYRLVPRLSQNFCGSQERSYRHVGEALVASRRLSSRPEAFFTTLRFSEIFPPNSPGHDNPLHYQLTDLSFGRQVDRLVARVIKQTTNLATIV